ncbi:hypothetical protein [Dyadobacter sediminis]|uniref:Outer membrane protein beta-barrel domain-containing protein n=1 Tax=Dyadobacter sediminis TaxID=1493691 RepID=A0A5R9K771_9BACT|nr:hypothetical protein [Dyadobacter sediminis]TLU89608.1 hypothetical protein FEM55_23015 [Dyadobacter sediminis]GGC03890.1 hypothetical protein GCM10011325_33580 [Dyadobacter sediminis]
MRNGLLSVIFIFSFSVSYGQNSNGISRKKSYGRKEYFPFSVSLRGGLTQFYGELNAQDMQGMTGISLGKSFNKNLALHFDYTAGKLGGEKVAFFNSYFINEYNSLELTAKWNLTEQFSRLEPGNAHFFLYGGIGLVYFSANAFAMDDNRLLRFTNSKLSARNPLFLRWGPPKGPAGIKKTREGILPLGTSLDFLLFKCLKTGIDYRFYFVRTDKMDATSGRRLLNPEESNSYSDTPNDKFSFLSVFLSYRFKNTRH